MAIAPGEMQGVQPDAAEQQPSTEASTTLDDFETQVREFSQKLLTLAEAADDTLTAEIAQE